MSETEEKKYWLIAIVNNEDGDLGVGLFKNPVETLDEVFVHLTDPDSPFMLYIHSTQEEAEAHCITIGHCVEFHIGTKQQEERIRSGEQGDNVIPFPTRH